METKKTLNTIALTVNLIFVLIGWFGSVYIIKSSEAGVVLKICAGIMIVSLLAAVNYLLSGYKKEGSLYYKIFIISFAVVQFVTVINGVVQPDSIAIATVIISLIGYGSTVALGISENLGKKKSYIMCAITFAAYIVLFVISLINSHYFPNINLIFMVVSQLTLSSAMWMSTQAKYADKELRGTK